MSCRRLQYRYCKSCDTCSSVQELAVGIGDLLRELKSIIPFLYFHFFLILHHAMTSTAPDDPCSADAIENLPIPPPLHYEPNKYGETVVLGIEGSANKVGVGIVRYSPSKRKYHILSNPRKTYIAPTGQGFLPKQTATHHQNHIVALVRAALLESFPNEENPEALISASEFMWRLKLPR